MPRRWERYKDVVYDQGRNELGFENWDPDQVGSGELLRRVIRAIEIDVPDENLRRRLPNNLVDWDSRFGPKARSHRSLGEALESTTDRFSYESLLFDFYRDELPPEEAFGGLVERAGKRYDFIAYLFFLKDWTRYLPISPANFDKAFAMLGVGLKTSQQCSWQNYQSYISVLRQVRDALRDQGLDDVRLIDAHSFCYMLARMELTESSLRASPIPEPLDISPETLTGTMPIDPPTPAGGAHVVDWDRQRAECAAVGRLAEYIALDAERERLIRAGRFDLASRIERVSDDHTHGYDIKSFNEDGTDRFIEVKAVRQEARTVSFYLTENERKRSHALPGYFLYLVFDVRSDHPKVKYLRPSDCNPDFLHPVLHLATVPIMTESQ